MPEFKNIKNLNIAVIGASGEIGSEFIKQFAELKNIDHIYGFSRKEMHSNSSKISYHKIDLELEETIEGAANIASKNAEIDLVINATGILHDKNIMPEKALKELSSEKLNKIFAVNTFGPALIMKHFLPKLSKENEAVFANLSARVGSISDNYLGGWYSYRASKTALNMLIKTSSIELKRTHEKAVIIGLHPGTVNSNLSRPFQKYVKEGKLFDAEFSVKSLVKTIEKLTPNETGKCFAWDGSEIPA